MKIVLAFAALLVWAWSALVLVNAQNILRQGRARSFADALSQAARMPIV